jgi:hypothetical protein
MYFADKHISILRRETIFTLQIDGRANRTSLHQDLRRLHKNLSAPRSLISGCTLHKDWEDGKKTRLRRRGALHPKSWMLIPSKKKVLDADARNVEETRKKAAPIGGAQQRQQESRAKEFSRAGPGPRQRLSSSTGGFVYPKLQHQRISDRISVW